MQNNITPMMENNATQRTAMKYVMQATLCSAMQCNVMQ